MEITQIQLSYIELQDRIVARINLGEDKHLSLILTRRICKFLIENLASFLKVDLPNVASPKKNDPLIQRALESESNDDVAMRKESGHAPAPVEDELPPGVQRDLPFQEREPEGSLIDKGYEPVLVLNAGCARTEEGLTFTLMIEGAQPLNLNLSPTLATAINHLLLDVVKPTQWFDGFGTRSHEDLNQVTMPSEEEKKLITYH